MSDGDTEKITAKVPPEAKALLEHAARVHGIDTSTALTHAVHSTFDDTTRAVDQEDGE